jgi:hypothetical protein
MTLDRALKLCVWAAKCHAHSQQSQMPLGRLPHTTKEVLEAIRVVEAHIAYSEALDGVRGDNSRPVFDRTTYGERS